MKKELQRIGVHVTITFTYPPGPGLGELSSSGDSALTGLPATLNFQEL